MAVARRRLTRLPPQGLPGDYQSYQALAPRSTHYRPATCEEYGCLDWRNGWKVHAQRLTAQQKAAITQARYRFSVLDIREGETWWVFDAGQPCFRAASHRVPLERPPILLVRHGDWRLPNGARRMFTRVEDWRDHFAEHQERLAAQHQRG